MIIGVRHLNGCNLHRVWLAALVRHNVAQEIELYAVFNTLVFVEADLVSLASD